MKTDKLYFTKVFVSTLFMASLLVLFSCKDDEEEQVGPLVGTWTLTQEVYANCEFPDDNEIVTLNCAADVNDCVKATFTKDNKFTFTYGDGSLSFNGTYSIAGNQLTVTVAGDSQVLTFTVSGTTLTITFNDDSCDVTQTFIKS